MISNATKRYEAYKEYYPEIINKFDELLTKSILGADTDEYINMWSLMHLTFAMRYDPDITFTIDDVECLRNKVTCIDIDTRKLEYIYPEIEDDSDIQKEDGIGYMQLEGDGSTYNVFRIS